MTHTPAPWSHMQPPYDSIPWHHIYGPDHNGAHIMHECRSAQEKMANARLIAAAPCLLEALTITRSQVALLGRLTDPVTSDVLSIADAAIAKARGETA